MKNKKIGFAITGSFCTFKQTLPQLENLVLKGFDVTPIFSNVVAELDTRFYKAKDFYNDVKAITGKDPICTISEAEPIGPKKLLDLVIIAPCTGNTLAKFCHAITDTPVLMAAKAHLRNDRPVLIALSSNDSLAANLKNIGDLQNRKNIFFVPFAQDDYINKKFSMIADLNLLYDSAVLALQNEQLQPILKRDL